MKKIQFIVDSKGKRQAVIVPYKYFQELWELAEDAIDLQLIEEVKDEPLLDWEEVKMELKTTGVID